MNNGKIIDQLLYGKKTSSEIIDLHSMFRMILLAGCGIRALVAVKLSEAVDFVWQQPFPFCTVDSVPAEISYIKRDIIMSSTGK